MPFSRYPDGGAAPLSLASGAASGYMPFTTHVTAGAFAQMFINIAVDGANITDTTKYPLVRIWANGAAGMPSDATANQITYSTTGNYVGINDASGASIGVAYMKKLAVLSDATPVTSVYQVNIVVTAPLPPNWQIQISNRETTTRTFTWVVAETLAGAEQPWLDVTTMTATFNLLVSRPVASSSQTVIVTNRGTGNMTVTSLDPVPPPLGTIFVVGAMPPSIHPGASGNIVVTLSGPQNTPQTATKTLDVALSAATPDGDATTTAGHNRRVTLTANFRKLQIALLLDTSGSMGDTDGGVGSRWNKLVSGAGSFLDSIATFASSPTSTLGIAHFPALTPANIVTPVPIPSDATALKLALTSIVPDGGTPMGDGLAWVQNPANGFFPNDGIDPGLKSRWIIMFSDGGWNDGGDPKPTANDLRANGIRIYTVRYGIPGNTEVDHNLLIQLAYDSTYSVQANGTTPNDLANAFKTVVKFSMSVDAAADPGGTLTAGDGEIRRPIVITPYDQQAVFSLNWNTSNAGRMRMELLTPTCDLITPDDFDPAHITFISSDRYQMFTIDRAYLENVANPSQPRFGTWTLIISSSQLQNNDSEAFTYDVMLDSRLRLAMEFDGAAYYAGDTIGIRARLTLDGAPISNASVQLAVTSPALSANNQYAAIRVTPDQLQKAQQNIAIADFTPLYVKKFAIELFGLGSIYNFTNRNTVTLVETSPGLYTGSFSNTSVPENYEFYVTATGITPDGVQFPRETSRQLYLQVRPAPDFSWVQVDYLEAIQNRRLRRAQVRVFPSDQFGNVVLVNPTDVNWLGLAVKGAEVTGDPISNLDGSYTLPITASMNTAFVVSLLADNTVITPRQPRVVPGNLKYAGGIVEYKPGIDLRNAFRNPETVLGSPLERAQDSYVALGSYGSLTVSGGRQAVAAQGRDDVTVFVQPGRELNSYKVEALRPDSDEWVLLGTSPGITQSFSLRSAKLSYTNSVRITDLSGRSFDNQLEPLSSPGVGIRGVGFKSLTDVRR